jgi:arabinofuranosyltransferase
MGRGRSRAAGKPAPRHRAAAAPPFPSWPPVRASFAAVALAAALAVYATGCWLVWRQTPIDDAYISFRYAQNLAAGEGLVFNPGERVEGYSGLSWVLLLAAGDVVGAPPPVLAKGLGALLGAGTLLLVGARRRLPDLLAAILLALSFPFVYHSVNGLETALAAFLVAALVLVPPDSAARRGGQHAAATLLVMTRPEGLAAVLLWTGALRIARRAPLGRHHRLVAATAAAAFLLQLAFRGLYHGDWIANSARAKLLPLDFALPAGLADLTRFVWNTGAWGVLLAAAVLAAVRPAPEDGVEDAGAAWPPARAVGLFLLAFALVLAASGGDSFPLWRFYVPLLPPFCHLAGRGLARLAPATGARRERPARLVAATAAALVVTASLAATVPAQRRAVAAEGTWVRFWSEVGSALGVAVPAGTRIALCPVGALPYHSGLPVVDMLGLTDRHIARVAPDRSYVYPGHQRHDGAYALARRPDLVLLANGPRVAAVGARFPWYLVRSYERDLAHSDRFRRDYRLAHLRLPSGDYVQLFVRRDAAGRLPALL